MSRRNMHLNNTNEWGRQRPVGLAILRSARLDLDRAISSLDLVRLGTLRYRRSHIMKGYRSAPRARRPISLLALGLLASVPLAVFGVERALEFKPGFNLLSPAEDVQVGRGNAAQVEKQLPILHDPEVDRYLGELGRRLAAYSPHNRSEYVWLFKVVNSRDINA